MFPMKFSVGTVVRALLHHTMGDVGIVESAYVKSSPGYKNGELYWQYVFTLLNNAGTREMPEFWLEKFDG